MYLPAELVELIMHFAGAYSYSPTDRPYIKEIKDIGEVAVYGVQRSLLHLRELEALRDAYTGRQDILDWMDTFHIVGCVY